jgi:hypothetical protein
MKNDKSYHKEIWRKIQAVNTWVFLGLGVAFAILGVLAMRQNNLTRYSLAGCRH